jgi:hypothetical protein
VGVSYDNSFCVTSQSVNGANPVSFQYGREGLLTGAGASAGGQAVANIIDPCNASSPLTAALFGSLGGGASVGFPGKGVTTLRQAQHFAPGWGGLGRTTNSQGMLAGYAVAAGIGAIPMFDW